MVLDTSTNLHICDANFVTVHGPSHSARPHECWTPRLFISQVHCHSLLQQRGVEQLLYTVRSPFVLAAVYLIILCLLSHSPFPIQIVYTLSLIISKQGSVSNSCRQRYARHHDTIEKL